MSNNESTSQSAEEKTKPEHFLSRGTGPYINCTDYDDAIEIITNLKDTIAQLQAENARLKSFTQWGESWTLVESLPLMIKATEKLLKQYSYDGGDYEEMMQAVECSKKALASLPEENK